MSIFNKLLSGRFILTVIAGLTFSVLAINKIIEPKDALIVIMVIVNAYFNKGGYERKQETTDAEGRNSLLK